MEDYQEILEENEPVIVEQSEGIAIVDIPSEPELYEEVSEKTDIDIAREENQKAQMEQFVRRTYGVNGVEMTVEQQPDLIGGFVLRVGDREFDWSLRGRVRQLQQRLIRR